MYLSSLLWSGSLDRESVFIILLAYLLSLDGNPSYTSESTLVAYKLYTLLFNRLVASV